jgi:23S rRNA (cytidine1920-2'-O)/16S rRNA (cytidine1409-2'-O)-methyltransferase
MGEIKLRLDLYTVEKGIIKSRERAKELIKSGNVTVNGRVIDKPSYDTEENDIIEVLCEQLKYVGRGGLKLEKAVKAFSIDLNEKVCIDIGASTGGFTDCMLQKYALKVYCR